MPYFDSIVATRAKRAENVALVTIGCALLSTMVFMLRAVQWDIEIRQILLGSNILCAPISMWMIWRYGLSFSASLIAILGLAIAIFSGPLTGGGTTSLATIWFLTLPVLGGLIGSKPGTAIGIGSSVLSFVILFFVENQMGVLPDLTPLEFRGSQAHLHQFATLTIFSVCVYTFLHQVKVSDGELDSHIVTLQNEVNARARAEQTAINANRSKSEFLANISHEIRTPMNGMLGVLQLLNKGKDLDATQRHLIDLGLTSSNTLLSLINDLLDISKIESGKFLIENERFDLRGLINSVYDRACQLAINKPINVMLECELESDWVKGDVLRIEQVLINLISNAIKFTPQGNVQIKAVYSIKAQTLSAAVIDTGIGVAAETLEHIFQPFTQAEASTTRQYGGTGLGLSICRELLNLMHGELTVESEPGQGSRFEFSIPMLSASSSDVTELERVENGGVNFPTSSRILLVEDNPINAELALALLEDLAIEADLASNGLEALDLIAKHRYQLVLMDCQMPVMDGYETTHKIRQSEKLKNLPIIALTANAMNGDREKCLAAGMSDYLSKPIDPDALEQKLAHWLTT